jgi:hypothetical protein
MSGNGNKPRAKGRRSAKARRIPLLMLGSDGETYACAPGRYVPRGVLQTAGVVVAVRLTHEERGIALDSLQSGIQETSHLLMGILDRKLGPKLDS